jgi:hypothetical protein
MQPPVLVVLAAGLGARYGGFKQIDPVGPAGEIVLDYSLFDAWKAGFGKVVFVIRPELEQTLREHFDPCLNGRMITEYIPQDLADLPDQAARPAAERTKPWGTGHAVWTARKAVDAPFAVINADDFYGQQSYRLLAAFLQDIAHHEELASLPHYAMVGFKLVNTLSPHGSVCRGICRPAADGFLAEVTEHTGIEPADDGGAVCKDMENGPRYLPADSIASMNMWGFSPGFLSQLEPLLRDFITQRGHEPKAEFYLPAAVDALIKAGKCRVQILRTPDPWFGVTYREDKPMVTARIQKLIADGVYPAKLWR